MLKILLDEKVSLTSSWADGLWMAVEEGAGLAGFDERAFLTQPAAGEVLQAYHHRGLNALPDMCARGAIVLCDETRGRVIIAADVAGHSTLYYAMAGGLLLVSPSLKEIDVQLRPAVDARSLAVYLACGFVYGQETILEGVYKIPPGGYLIVEKGRLRRGVASHLKSRAGRVPQQRLLWLLREGLDRCFSRLGHHPAGVMLSGGFDSSFLCALLRRRQGRVNTYTVNMMGYNGRTLRQAEKMSGLMRTQHAQIDVTARDYFHYFKEAFSIIDEPVLDMDLPLIRLAMLRIGRDVPYVLHGFGSDEVVGERVLRFGKTLKDLSVLPGHKHWARRLSARDVGRIFLETKVPQELRAHYTMCTNTRACFVFPFFEQDVVRVAAQMPVHGKKDKMLLRRLSPGLNRILPVRQRSETGQMPPVVKDILVEAHQAALLRDGILLAMAGKASIRGALDRKDREAALRMIVFMVWATARSRPLSSG